MCVQCFPFCRNTTYLTRNNNLTIKHQIPNSSKSKFLISGLKLEIKYDLKAIIY